MPQARAERRLEAVRRTKERKELRRRQVMAQARLEAEAEAEAEKGRNQEIELRRQEVSFRPSWSTCICRHFKRSVLTPPVVWGGGGGAVLGRAGCPGQGAGAAGEGSAADGPQNGARKTAEGAPPLPPPQFHVGLRRCLRRCFHTNSPPTSAFSTSASSSS